MRIRIKDHVKLSGEKMVKVALAATPRALLDLYCLAPGQRQAVHTHDEQDKIYVVLEGRGRFTLGAEEHRLEPGEALVAASGVPHGLVNDAGEPLVVLVMVTPPPPHGASAPAEPRSVRGA
jgi:quercetin dioxygenase-like cupin family protein